MVTFVENTVERLLKKTRHCSDRMIKGEDVQDSNAKDSMIESRLKHTKTRVQSR